MQFTRAIEARVSLDLGCGRGEWLELMTEEGLDARGVDLDDGMLAVSTRLGLQAIKQDALTSISDAKDASLDVVSAFHLVEHLPFEAVLQLIGEAQRALRPGGLLILETPNPDNIRVSSLSFFLDATHNRPIPSTLLQFAAEFSGFADCAIIGLHEDDRIEKTSIRHVLQGPSQDYALVAQKAGGISISSLLSGPTGLSYELAVEQFDRSISQRLDEKASRLEMDDLAKGLSRLSEGVNHIWAERLPAIAKDHAALAEDHAALTSRSEQADARITTVEASISGGILGALARLGRHR
nr:class I SAM-dependent methyltransferase [Aliihoeflea sp. 40Bstr573]